MTILLRSFLALILALFLVSCSSTAVSRQDLVDRLGTSNVYVGSHYFYMGSKGGIDYVTHTWERDGFSNAPGSRVFEVRSNELPIGQPMNYTTDSKQWREIDILEKPKTTD